MKYKLVDNGKRNQTIIKVVGVGGCGGNAPPKQESPFRL